jgi:hypothetical protein
MFERGLSEAEAVEINEIEDLVSKASRSGDGLQDGNDLILAEFALPHSGLLASYSPGNL